MRLATSLRRDGDAGAKPSDYYCILCAGYGDAAGTPGFVIGNRLVPGAIDTQTMQQIVEAERAAAKTRK